MPVQFALVSDPGLGSIAVAFGGFAVGGTRLQHAMSKAEGFAGSGALPSKPQWPAFTRRLYGHQVPGRR